MSHLTSSELSQLALEQYVKEGEAKDREIEQLRRLLRDVQTDVMRLNKQVSTFGIAASICQKIDDALTGTASQPTAAHLRTTAKEAIGWMEAAKDRGLPADHFLKDDGATDNQASQPSVSIEAAPDPKDTVWTDGEALAIAGLSGRTIEVRSEAELWQAMEEAQPGDTILVSALATAEGLSQTKPKKV